MLFYLQADQISPELLVIYDILNEAARVEEEEGKEVIFEIEALIDSELTQMLYFHIDFLP